MAIILKLRKYASKRWNSRKVQKSPLSWNGMNEKVKFKPEKGGREKRWVMENMRSVLRRDCGLEIAVSLMGKICFRSSVEAVKITFLLNSWWSALLSKPIFHTFVTALSTQVWFRPHHWRVGAHSKTSVHSWRFSRSPHGLFSIFGWNCHWNRESTWHLQQKRKSLLPSALMQLASNSCLCVPLQRGYLLLSFSVWRPSQDHG